MKCDWAPLRRELAIWRAEARSLPIWWRDDDAVTATPALARLLDLSTRTGVPIHLAVIPADVDTHLAETVAQHRLSTALVHGWQHRDHAPPGEKKAEFGHARPDAIAEIAMGLTRIKTLFKGDALPVFVPPWNRIDQRLTASLPAAGYAGLSTFTPRAAACPFPGLVQINTHLDPIFWRGGGGVTPPEMLIAGLVQLLRDRRAGNADASEPLGLLTHHLVHDADIWDVTQEVLSELLEGGAKPVWLKDVMQEG
jgi:hypothetical protein